MTYWLPECPDFRLTLGKIRRAKADSDQLTYLAHLAQHNLNYLQVIQMEQALQRLGSIEADGFSMMQMAVFSSSTVDHLLPGIRVASLRRHLIPNIYICPYGQYQQSLLDPDSTIHGFRPETALFSLSASEVTNALPISLSAEEAHRRIADFISNLVSLWAIVRNSFSATVIQQSFLNTGHAIFGNFDRMQAGTPVQFVRRLNEQLVQAAAENDVLVLDMERAVEKQGLDFWFDATKWLHGKIEISPQASSLYGELVARIIGAQLGRSKKCLVLDLDNTLWGGVVGDDGIDQLILGEGSALGEAFVAFQKYVRQLSERGVILAVCSKNEQKTAESVFTEHPEMVLQRSDFAAFVANWDDKALNLERIAHNLNIGLDSLVFVDDNPAERARVRQSLPMIAVPELPRDPADYAKCLSDAGYFEAVSFTADDLQRNRQYAADASRGVLQMSSQSLEDYLESLQMTAIAGPFQDVDLQRITQLINKTNQFNMTTRRRSLNEVRVLAADSANLTLQVRLADRFGDNGLVSAVIVRPVPGQLTTMDIDIWLMSCRVFGRELEFEVMNIVVAKAKARKMKQLTATYIPTPRNELIRDLYSRLGFEQLASGPDLEPGTSKWALDLSTYDHYETFISADQT